MINELEIAKQVGPTAFVVYHAIKSKPNAMVREIMMETGLVDST